MGSSDSPTREKVEFLESIIKRATDIKRRSLKILSDENGLADDMDRLSDLQQPDLRLRAKVRKDAQIGDSNKKQREKNKETRSKKVTGEE